jgi:glycosyltransferase involved in cell wall biosynthesis
MVFYAERYRDIDFARSHGLSSIAVLCNGASEVEFAAAPDPTFRRRHGIRDDDFVILTVGTPVNSKGHTELAAAFGHLDPTRAMTLLLCGQWPKPPPPSPPPLPVATAAAAPDPIPARSSLIDRGPTTAAVPDLAPARPSLIDRALLVLRNNGAPYFLQRASLSLYCRTRALLTRLVVHPLVRLGGTAFRLTRQLGWGVACCVAQLIQPLQLDASPPPAPPQRDPPVPARLPTIDDWIDRARQQPRKTVLKVHFSREETVQAFLNADLFVFASNIEYSPLVLFEAAAAGLPFITVPVGNAEEIVRWTGAGVVCPADKDARGYTRVDPKVLAGSIQALADDVELRRQLGAAGRDAWRRTFNWQAIAKRYETVLRGACNGRRISVRLGEHGVRPSRPSTSDARANEMCER